MKIDFFICRHGETDKNVAGVWQGSGTDAVLNDVGHKQAEELAQKLRSKLMIVYSSPLVRAVQTANIIVRNAETLPLFMIMQDLRECNFGDAEGISFEETKRRYGEEFINKLLWPTEETADMHIPNGESKREVFERVYACFKWIICCHSFNKAQYSVCVVCHAGVLSALQFGLGLKDVSFKNCAILHLQYDTYTRKFIECRD